MGQKKRWRDGWELASGEMDGTLLLNNGCCGKPGRITAIQPQYGGTFFLRWLFGEWAAGWWTAHQTYRFVEHLDMVALPQIHTTLDMALRSLQVLLLFRASDSTHTLHSSPRFFVCTMTHFKRERALGRGWKWVSEREELVSTPLIAFVRFRSCDQLAFVRNHMHLEWG